MFTYFIPARISRTQLIRSCDELAYKTSLIKYFSHEVRTPLTAVSLGLEILERPDVPSVSEMLELTTTLRRSCDISLEILDNMLIYERIISGNLNLKVKRTDAVLAVKELLSAYSEKAVTAELVLTVQSFDERNPNSESFVSIDCAAFKSVFAAVLNNALRAPVNTLNSIDFKMSRVLPTYACLHKLYVIHAF
jgi:signal transduction histidine kinase